MKREDVARTIRWPWIIWIAGLVNVGAMLPQLYKIITTWKIEGLALSTIVLYLLIQLAFATDGYFKRNPVFTVCMGLSALVSATIIGMVVYIRYF